VSQGTTIGLVLDCADPVRLAEFWATAFGTRRWAGVVALQGIRNAEVVRDLLRGSGQFEAARWDKARWR
jgi:hypothetical protein